MESVNFDDISIHLLGAMCPLTLKRRVQFILETELLQINHFCMVEISVWEYMSNC